jgi:ZIP family zinc transporter
LSFAQTVLLGALAGFTIFLGLPAGRIKLLSDRARVGLAMFSVGILAFIFVDVLEHGLGIVDGALDSFKEDGGSFGHLAALAALLIIGFGLGSAGLGILERRLRPKARAFPPIAGGSTATAFTPDEAAQLASEADLAQRRALQTGIVIAVAIGLHNFAEGLAIGVSARAGAVSLATVLIIGFALHNATEGFGICGPMSAEAERPSWGFLGLLGLIGGAPTFLGTVVGHAWVSDAVSVLFFAVAAGSILYVVEALFHVNRKFANPTLVTWMVLLGLALGFATDFVVEAAGG